MEQGLHFDKKDLHTINTNLLVSLIAQQQALFEILFDHVGLPQEGRDERIDGLYRKRVEIALGHLYTQYGLTPDVLLPDDHPDKPKSDL